MTHSSYTFLAPQYPTHSVEFLQELDRRFLALARVRPAHRELANTTLAAVVFQMPSGHVSLIDYLVIKVDSSVNTVTIYPYGTETILGTTSLVLTARYDKALLTFSHTTNDWITI